MAGDVGDNYLHYPHRRYGMDHDRYDWTMLHERTPVVWPEGKSLALWVNVSLQFYPLDQRGVPFKVPGGMTMPYPDLRHFTLRDYGNRVGVYRCMDALAHHGLQATYAINGRLAQRYPYLMDAVKEAGAEVLAHGWDMDSLHYGGQSLDEERQQVVQTLDVLREATGQPVEGWLSPARNQSENTPELLAEHGVRYFCDWVNDDMPYSFRTARGPLWAMPLSTELEDRFVLMNNLHSEDSWVEQVCDAADFLIAEAAEQGGRILGLSIHPWMLGQPHRISRFEEVLAYLAGKREVWSAPAAEILDSFQGQQ